MPAIGLSRPVHYPESDGRPFAETQFHARAVQGEARPKGGS